MAGALLLAFGLLVIVIVMTARLRSARIDADSKPSLTTSQSELGVIHDQRFG